MFLTADFPSVLGDVKAAIIDDEHPLPFSRRSCFPPLVYFLPYMVQLYLECEQV